MQNPHLKIDLAKVEANTKYVVDLAAQAGIEIMGVTKAVTANLAVARAMLAGGVSGLADSRLENLEHLRNGLELTNHPLMLLRIPMLSEVEEVVLLAEISLNSELKVIKALNQAALQLGVKHEIILMVDLGDRREGAMVSQVLPLVREIDKLTAIKLRGLGTNFACFGGVLPTTENMELLANLQQEIREHFNLDLTVISGGNSSSLPRLKKQGLPAHITELRVGETILLGSNVVTGESFFGTKQDAFLLGAEIIELKSKPAQPAGPRGPNAFGEETTIHQQGLRQRAILGIGRQDIAVGGITPILSGVELVGGSSDHLIIDVTESKRKLEVGDTIYFRLDYGGLLRAMTSEYVAVTYQQN
ncbi:MAG: alanine/ornithine racemase family PLP-dependent enzyme [Bacillota bacterium]